ncbi:MAG TPA: CDP-alcohol phosphatidyltransferase family protein [Candidatus Dormibacteraeota bacterium]|nr:CDP-alcohol phosphatidyltransferase family protein [Candidatus Dormibacteraeota bacterium]
MAGALAASAAFTAIAARRLGGPMLSAPNALTLTRAGAAGMACGTAFSGAGRRSTLAALLLGCTVCDWLDGPLARRLGPTRLGAVLDLEADSWLTLWGAAAAYRLGGLPGAALLAPALRYPLVAAASRRTPHRAWQRAAGVAQMAVIACGLTARRPPRAVVAAVAAAQLAALGADFLSAATTPPAAGSAAAPAAEAPARRTARWLAGTGSRPASPAAGQPAAPAPH